MRLPSVSELFERFDKNKDGKLTKDEVPPFIWEHISKADANKDGAVTKAELEAFRKQKPESTAPSHPQVPASK
jgi:Ca2+-binding EF-hand superfamily protein